MEHPMTIMKIDTDDAKAINQIKNIVVQQFHIDVQIVEEFNDTVETSKTKWAEFAEKMDGLFTPDIVEHINKSRKEARDNFIANV